MLITKRDGTLEEFDARKIQAAIAAALNAVGESVTLSSSLTDAVVYRISGRQISVEEVQDIVECVLFECGHFDAMRAYIVYREQHAGNRDTRAAIEDAVSLFDGYLNQSDWQVNENANRGYSLQGLQATVSESLTKRYWLRKFYPPAVVEAHQIGVLHIHDLGILASYCVGWDLYDLLSRGFGGVPGYVHSKPPRHLGTALGQIVNFLYSLQGEAAGAQALSNFDTLLAPFIRYDKLSYDDVRQAMQEFIFNMNVPTRTGGQIPFTNLSFDLTPSSIYADQPVLVGGELKTETYGEFQDEMDMLNRAFCEVMAEGDAQGRVFTFPIPTYAITKSFDWDSEKYAALWQMTARYGLPYFCNYINSDISPEDSRSMCPLHPDTRVIVKTVRGISVRTIREIYTTQEQHGSKYQTLCNGIWSNAVAVKTETKGCLKITLDNGESVIMDECHWQPTKYTYNDLMHVVQAKNLREGYYLPFSGYPIRDSIGSYLDGFAVGAYLGDGSCDNGALIYSLSDKKDDAITQLTQFFTDSGYKITTSKDEHLVSLRILSHNKAAQTWMQQFVSGLYSETKRILPHTWNMGTDFLRGILDGWYATDGGSRGRIYTNNIGLCDDFATLCGLLGIGYRIDRDGDKREGRYSQNPVYTMKYHVREKYGNIFFYQDGYWWIRISKIEKSDYSGSVFCFQVDSTAHLFQLANGLVTHNCRLRLNVSKIRRGGIFASNPLTGSVGVVTINLPHLAYESSKNVSEFYKLLKAAMELARDSLEIKRKVVERFTEDGLYPYTRYYLQSVKDKTGLYWTNHFSTIGLVGMHEALLELGLGGIVNGREFAIETLEFMRRMCEAFSEETGHLYNLEATPAESTSYRLARLDRKRWPDIPASGTVDAPYYTNSTQLPVNYTEDIFETLKHQDDLQSLYTGGTVLHGFLGEQIDDWRQARTMVKRIFERYRLPYLSLTPTFSVCAEHKYLPGNVPTCPYCGAACEVYSRVVGYLRPVAGWNIGKRQEFKDRVVYQIAS